MLRKIFILLCILLAINTLSIAQESTKFFGILYSQDDSTVVEDVHIINISKKLGTTSNKEGMFRITASPKDSLLFSVLGFEYEMIVTDSSHFADELNSLYLYRRVYELPAVYVWPYITYTEFRQAFINFDHEEPTVELNLPEYENEIAAAAANPHVSLGSPITALYNRFSKEGKELRKYQETVERDNYEQFLASKYNETIVQKITGIKTFEEVVKFMNYCNISDGFIAQSNEYAIYLSILQCYSQYKDQDLEEQN